MLVDDLTEVIDGVTSITHPSIGVAEPARWIARIGNVGSISIRNVEPAQTNCIQRQEDVGSTQVEGGGIDLRRIRLIEHIEQAGAELKLLRLGDVEVLEE